MTTKIIDLEQGSTNLDAILAQLDDQTDVLLVRGETPIARLISEKAVTIQPRTPGLHAGTTWVSEDFDAPLPDAFWLGEE